MRYDAYYFLKLFRATREDQWCVKQYHDGSFRHCVVGHLGVRAGYRWPKKANALYYLVKKALKKNILLINDGIVDEYQQTTPRARVLRALLDCIEKGY